MASLRGLCYFVLFPTMASAMLVCTAVAEDQARSSAAKRSPRAEPSLPREKSTEQRSFVTFKDGRLDVRIENRSLQWILERISQQSGVPIVSASGLGVQPLSIQFEKLSLEEGLRRILKGHDVFFFLGADEKALGALRAVWVYPKGQGRSLMPFVPEAAELSHDLIDPNPDTRARAVDALVARKGQQSVPVLLQALKDPDESVRFRALYVALNSALILPQDVLMDLVRNDSSPLVRFQAMEAIANLNSQDPSVVNAIAEFALSDSDPSIREQAQQILDMASRPPAIEPMQGQEGQGGQEVQGQEGTQQSKVEAKPKP